MSDGIRFRATIELGGKTATGIPVPDEVVAALEAGRRPAVRVTVAAHTYRTTIASMGGRFMIPLSAEHRAHAGVAAGDEVEVQIESDTAARDVPLPSDLAEALREDGSGAILLRLPRVHPPQGVGPLDRGSQETRHPRQPRRDGRRSPTRRKAKPTRVRRGPR